MAMQHQMMVLIVVCNSFMLVPYLDNWIYTNDDTWMFMIFLFGCEIDNVAVIFNDVALCHAVKDCPA